MKIGTVSEVGGRPPGKGPDNDDPARGAAAHQWLRRTLSGWCSWSSLMGWAMAAQDADRWAGAGIWLTSRDGTPDPSRVA
jgi:hypothetical protein